jgi:quercetin dioxygenase-like cupin family protein
MEVGMSENKAEIIGKVLSAAKIVDYQQGAIVSHEILKRDTGTVTIFAFDQGQGLSEHTAPFDALVQVLDGAVQIKIAGAPHDLKAGDLIIMPANKPHALQALTRMKMMLVMIKS